MANAPLYKILVVEDDPITSLLIIEALSAHFGPEGLTAAPTMAQALDHDPGQFDLVMADINLTDGSGLDLLERLLRRRPDLPVVMVTSQSDLKIAMRAIRGGAYDYVMKVGDYLLTLPLVVEKNMQVWRIKQENLSLHKALEQTLAEVRTQNRQLEDSVNQLAQLARTDGLTGLANRRSVEEALTRCFADAQRQKSCLSVIMIDLDGFKQLNDTLGHLIGDRLLQLTAKTLNDNCRRSDLAGRYGGDEFILLLPRADVAQAQQIAYRVRQQFLSSAGDILPPDAQQPCDMSIGVACMPMTLPEGDAQELVAQADAALYQAKHSGKGRISTFHPGLDDAHAPASGQRPSDEKA